MSPDRPSFAVARSTFRLWLGSVFGLTLVASAFGQTSNDGLLPLGGDPYASVPVRPVEVDPERWTADRVN